MVQDRKEVALIDKWNVEALFPDFKNWEQELIAAKLNGDRPEWPDLKAFIGRLHEGPATLLEAIQSMMEHSRKLGTLYTYAHLRHDEDIANDQHKASYKRIMAFLHEFGLACAWFEPELLALPDATIDAYLKAPELAEYRFYLEKLVRIKKHMLPREEEELMALASKALSTPYKAFNALSDADFVFGTVKDGNQAERELTHASFGMYLRSQDRILRENAFKTMHGKYQKYENTLCELINGQIQSHVFNSRARKFSSCLEAALFPKNIDTEVYHSLVKAVNDNLGGLHKYIALREKILNLGQLHLYDMYVPLIKEMEMTIPYGEAEELVIESVAPLGAEYQNQLRQGLKEQGWVDKYENKNKRSGAYSSGCYDSMPYILMNYKEQLRDVFTLAHEVGHSMHSLSSHRHQPYQYGDYPIFLAEVASTFNEELLVRLLLQRATKKEEKIYLINQKIEDIRATLFRQTMFAEFELFLHETAERNVPITPALLNEKYRELNSKYFGLTVIIDKEADSEWARIPHFYYDFYVFQYATGISAALALSDRVLKGGEAERAAYLEFLRAGSSKYPIEILQLAGVDMRSPKPVEAAIGKFNNLVEELSRLISS